MSLEPTRFVSRGGLKLQHALVTFGLEVQGLACADFGCNVGGFTDCLLRAGAAKIFALDTGYGALAWTLRNDARVVVRERTNALHAEVPAGGVDVVVIDMAWTPQRLCVPAALRWLRSEGAAGGDAGRIVTLVKPHYELTAEEKPLLRRGVLEESEAERVVARAVASFAAMGARVMGVTRSPILGGAGKGPGGGNAEWLVVLEREG